MKYLAGSLFYGILFFWIIDIWLGLEDAFSDGIGHTRSEEGPCFSKAKVAEYGRRLGEFGTEAHSYPRHIPIGMHMLHFQLSFVLGQLVMNVSRYMKNRGTLLDANSGMAPLRETIGFDHLIGKMDLSRSNKGIIEICQFLKSLVGGCPPRINGDSFWGESIQPSLSLVKMYIFTSCIYILEFLRNFKSLYDKPAVSNSQ